MACLAIAAGILCRATTPAALLLSVLVALVIWVFGENFGGLLTGQATDPNTGPLLILLAVAYWPGSGDELLTAVDVIRRPGERRVDHDVHGERGHVGRGDHPADRQLRP